MAVYLKFRNRCSRCPTERPVDAIGELAQALMRHLDATRIPLVALADNILQQ